ncbi:multiheme c-type cytochrome [Novosphingobium cyanobacteriorum]|uniref:Multiheme c-type cytochrome n=1 Tax=Novosphingobium cyanobacteriorum TaxID=3024215 RepID=A0ABT6CEM7_9SPHN|nr:multiheme c-type cytochrome [Novosphingobium cyanobacteriorum]MDF8332292.1 multiheme c-type cytochrome [Novosphingobium cyanobacteriorum]
MQGITMIIRRLAAVCRSLPRPAGAALFLCLAMAGGALATAWAVAPAPVRAENPAASLRAHMGVASCAGSTCHGRSVASGTPVRQDELLRWQEESSPTGAHSRAWRVVTEARGQAIARRLGLDGAGVVRECAGCHASQGAKNLNDGVDCEACHGNAGGWLSTHYTVGASHARNVGQGMVDLTAPKVRAGVCLDCHLSGDGQGQFIAHRIMAAGHPRISFELDLFSTLQAHHDEDADYIQRKGHRTNSMQMWAVGQAEAVKRGLELYSQPAKAQDGIFPEFTFYDCHSCHRRITDNEDGAVTAVPNPGRPIHLGMPPYNDENIILLLAAAKVVAPDLAAQFDARSKAFHRAMGANRAETVAAAQALRQSAEALASRMGGADFSRERTFAIMDAIASEAISDRLTDYQGSVQSVMAIDTLLNGMVNSGMVSAGASTGLRGQINQAYAAVRDPNGFQPIGFRRALGGAIRSIRSLR